VWITITRYQEKGGGGGYLEGVWVDRDVDGDTYSNGYIRALYALSIVCRSYSRMYVQV
jgi:hypothetical protein